MTIHYNEVHDEKLIYIALISPLLLFGCSMMSNDSNKESQSVPQEMPASNYVGQGFQPKAEKVLLNMRRNTEKNTKTR